MTTKPTVVVQRSTEQLFNGQTGEHVGQVDLFGREQYGLSPAQQRDLTAAGNLSGVTYDTQGRAIAWTIDNVGYTAVYTASTITITSTDGYERVVDIDPQGRIAASTVLE